MRLFPKYLISLYPKSWRKRYGAEFDALLEEVPPTWRTMLDVLGGACKMQIKSGSLWKPAASAVVAAVLVGAAVSRPVPREYRSEAVLRPDKARLNLQAAATLSRAALAGLIVRENLYQKDRARVSMDDLALRLRNSVLIWTPGKDGPLRVRVTAPDPAEARRAAEGIAGALVDAKAAAWMDPASLATRPERPPLRVVLQLGLLAGVLAGVLFALFNGLHVWKPVVALGAAGALLGAAASSVVPNIFQGLSVVSCHTSDMAAVRRLIDSAMDAERLAAMVRQFNLYPGDRQPAQKLRENLRLQADLRPFGNPMTGTANGSYDLVIGFRYPNQALAQFVTEATAAYLTDENVQRRAGASLEMVAPAFVHVRPHLSNGLIGSGSGLLLGLSGAVVFGLWRAWATRRQLRHA